MKHLPYFEIGDIHTFVCLGVHHHLKRTSLRDWRLFWNSYCNYHSKRDCYALKLALRYE